MLGLQEEVDGRDSCQLHDSPVTFRQEWAQLPQLEFLEAGDVGLVISESTPR